MFVPLIIGAIITTICQGFFHFDLWETLGNPMKDMFSSSGQMLLIGLMLFCTGTSLKLSDMADALHRGVILIATRLIVAYLLSALYYRHLAMKVSWEFLSLLLFVPFPVQMLRCTWASFNHLVIKQTKQALVLC